MGKVGYTALAAILVLLAMAASGSEPVGVSGEGEDAVVKARVPLQVPDAAKKRPNPVAPEATSLERGKRLFASQCAMCHGAKGDGSGSLARQLNMAMPDFTDRSEQTRFTDGEMFWVLEHGHGRMPAEERLSDEWKWDLVNHIRTLGPKG